MEFIEGKVALITGGAGVIGSVMVRELLKNGIKGIAIVDTCKNSGENIIKEIVHNFGKNMAIFIKADITIKEELEGAFETTVKTFKQLDIVINNAAIINESEWKKVIAINFIALVESTYLALQKYLPEYKSGHEATIVNIASDLGFISLRNLPVYSATKHAVVGLGQALGTEEFYEKYKTRIVTLCPRAVNTPFLTEVTEERFWFSDVMIKKFNEMRLLQPENVADALIEVLKKGENGSLWVVENDGLYPVVVPDTKQMKIEEKI